MYIYQAAKWAKYIGDTATTIESFIETFYKVFLNDILTNLNTLQANNIYLYKKVLAEYSGTISHVVLFGKIQDTFYLKTIVFSLVSKSIFEPPMLNVGLYDAVDNVLWHAGKTAHISDTIRTKGFWKQGPIKTINNAIKSSILLHPESVGPPVDIVIMNRKGKLKWVQKKRCPPNPL